MTIGLAMAATPVAAETVKVGFITTLSGPAGVIGKPMKNAFELALELLEKKRVRGPRKWKKKG